MNDPELAALEASGALHVAGSGPASDTPMSDASRELYEQYKRMTGYTDDPIEKEISAMREVGTALSSLDEPARRRVLRWANDMFWGDRQTKETKP
jgi:hypothetical protein